MHATAGLGKGNRHEPKVHHNISFSVANADSSTHASADSSTLANASALAYYYHERQQWQQQPRRAQRRSPADTDADTDSNAYSNTHTDSNPGTYSRLQHIDPELLHKS